MLGAGRIFRGTGGPPVFCCLPWHRRAAGVLTPPAGRWCHGRRNHFSITFTLTFDEWNTVCVCFLKSDSFAV